MILYVMVQSFPKGAAVGFVAGAALAVKEMRDEHAAREEQKENQHEQTMGGF